MTLDQGIAAVAAAVIVTAAGFFAGIITSRQKNDELLLLAINHLCGGTQERNVGISAIELYWNKNRHRQLCVSMLVGSAIYLLRESKQKGAQHELYNLNRIMTFLLIKKKLYSDKRTVLVYYKHLDVAVKEALADIKINTKRETGDNRNDKLENASRYGLWVDKSQLEKWHRQLNPGNQMNKPEEERLVSISESNSLAKKSILEKHSARISFLRKGFTNPPKLITINKDENENEIWVTENDEWWYCLEGAGIIIINNKVNHFMQSNAIVPISKGIKFTIRNKSQMPLQLVSISQKK